MNIETEGRHCKTARRRYQEAALLACTALVATLPGSLLAQESANTGGSTVLERITIDSGDNDDQKSIVATRATSGSKMASDILDTPAAVSVITAKEMQQRGVQTVEEALQYTAGVTTDFYGSDDRFDYFKIRGFDAYTYRDGLTLGRPFGALREETYAYERVEVLKGGNSTTFGVSDPGGSVNYSTKVPKRTRFGEAYVTGGSYGRAETGFDFGDNITSDDTLSYRLTGKLRNADAEYDYSRDDEKFFMGGLTWRPTDVTSLTVVYDHLNKDGVPGGGGHPVGSHFDRSRFFGEPDYNYRGTNRNSLNVMFDHDFGSGLTLSSNARYSKANTDFGYAYISSTPTNGSTIANRSYFGNDTETENFLIDTRLQYDTRFENVESRSLVGVFYNDYTSGSKNYFGAAPNINWMNPVYTGAPSSVPLFSNSLTDQKTKAIYLQQDLTFFDRLTVSAGLRNDWIDTDQTNRLNGTTASGDISELTKRIGVSYKVTNEIAPYISYAESVVPASGLTVEPERGEQIELGVKYRPDAFPALFTASIYDLKKNNITVTSPITSLPTTIGEVRVRGLDLEAKAEVTDNLSLTAAYSYLDAEITENGTGGNVGNRPQFVPEHQASLWVNYTLEGNDHFGDMTFGLGGRYTGAYYFDNSNKIETGSSVTVDAAFSYKIQETASLDVNVSNLFNEKHVSYGGFGADFYNPGRAFSVTLRKTW